MRLLESIEKSILTKVDLTDSSHGRIILVYSSGTGTPYIIQASLFSSNLPACIFNDLRSEFQHHGLTNSFYSNRIIKRILNRIIKDIDEYKNSDQGKKLIHESILSKLEHQLIFAFKAGVTLEEIKLYLEKIYNLETVKEIMHS